MTPVRVRYDGETRSRTPVFSLGAGPVSMTRTMFAWERWRSGIANAGPIQVRDLVHAGGCQRWDRQLDLGLVARE